MFAGGLRWKEQWLNSGGCIRLRVLRLGSSANFSRNSTLILPIVDIRERGSTAGRCVPKFLAQCVVVDWCTSVPFCSSRRHRR